MLRQFRPLELGAVSNVVIIVGAEVPGLYCGVHSIVVVISRCGLVVFAVLRHNVIKLEVLGEREIPFYSGF